MPCHAVPCCAQVRVNTISAGPLGSRAAKAIGFIDDMIRYSYANAPIQKELAAKVGLGARLRVCGLCVMSSSSAACQAAGVFGRPGSSMLMFGPVYGIRCGSCPSNHHSALDIWQEQLFIQTVECWVWCADHASVVVLLVLLVSYRRSATLQPSWSPPWPLLSLAM